MTTTRVRPAPSAREQRDIAESIRPIFFAPDSGELSQESRDILDGNIAVFKRWPRMQILIAGHTDETGGLTYNLNLGGERASNVRTYLVDHGIALDRIVIVSAGEHLPDTIVDTVAESDAERRTEFILYWETPGPVQ